ncbi:MAG: hypothetical protein M1398_08015, partial [Deltaproteobacteria bacterium]|nr:hypothetical protein [Deltaproteobacteria bacterium]
QCLNTTFAETDEVLNKNLFFKAPHLKKVLPEHRIPALFGYLTIRGILLSGDKNGPGGIGGLKKSGGTTYRALDSFKGTFKKNLKF